MDETLKDLLRRYAIDEQDNPNPTDDDLEDSRQEGIAHFKNEEGLLQFLKWYYKD